MSLNDRAQAAVMRAIKRGTPEPTNEDQAKELAKGKHTPGPWQPMHTGTASDEHARSIRSYGGAWISDVLKQGTVSERAANARLIAAAPELLEACKAYMKDANGNNCTLRAADREYAQSALCRSLNEATKRFADAIARAEGGAK